MTSDASAPQQHGPRIIAFRSRLICSPVGVERSTPGRRSTSSSGRCSRVATLPAVHSTINLASAEIRVSEADPLPVRGSTFRQRSRAASVLTLEWSREAACQQPATVSPCSVADDSALPASTLARRAHTPSSAAPPNGTSMPSDLLILHLSDAPPATPTTTTAGDRLTIRPIIPADHDALASLYLAGYPAGVGAANSDEARAEIHATFAGDFGELLSTASLIAHLDDTPAGAILTTTRSISDDDLHSAFVIDFFVDPDLRRRGIGRALLLHAIHGCRHARHDSLALRVGEGTSRAALALYQRIGFRARAGILPGRDPRAVRRILQALSDWFGSPEAIDNYAAAAADERLVSLLARERDEIVGVALLARHFPESAELHLIAVSPAARGHGIGPRSSSTPAPPSRTTDAAFSPSTQSARASTTTATHRRVRSTERSASHLSKNTPDSTGPGQRSSSSGH